MAAGYYIIIVFSLIFSISSGSNEFDGLLTDSQGCEDSCVKSYSPHTNLNGGDESEACSRGCRLYSISEFVARDDDLKQNLAAPRTAMEYCFGACVEAYNETSDNTLACKSGCESQQEKSKTAKEEEKKKEEDSAEGAKNIHLLSPLMQVRSVYSSLVGALHVVRSSIVTYFATDDDSIVAVESPPQIMVEVVDEEGPGSKMDDGPLLPLSPLSSSHSMDRKDGSGEFIQDSGEPSVVRCVSQRLGVPPPLLVASALVLVLFTLYVIFAICTTAAPAKARKDGLSVQADPLPLPIKLVRPEDLTRLSLMEEDELQAPPLPTKVKLPDTHV